eukprot:Gb_32722 [translate_table: standard]
MNGTRSNAQLGILKHKIPLILSKNDHNEIEGLLLCLCWTVLVLCFRDIDRSPSTLENLTSEISKRNYVVCCFFSAIGQGYSIVLPEKLHTGKWNVYRSARSPLKLVDRFPEHPEIETLHGNFVHAVDSYQDFKYLGTRVRVDGTIGDYKWMTYGEAGTAQTALGSGLVYHGIPKGACIGLYLINRPEWIITEHACSSYSYISVPLYDTLGPDAVKYIVNHAEISAVFCVPDNLKSLMDSFLKLFFRA